MLLYNRVSENWFPPKVESQNKTKPKSPNTTTASISSKCLEFLNCIFVVNIIKLSSSYVILCSQNALAHPRQRQVARLEIRKTGHNDFYQVWLRTNTEDLLGDAKILACCWDQTQALM